MNNLSHSSHETTRVLYQGTSNVYASERENIVLPEAGRDTKALDHRQLGNNQLGGVIEITTMCQEHMWWLLFKLSELTLIDSIDPSGETLDKRITLQTHV